VRAADVIASGGVLLRPACGSFEEAVRGLVDVLIANQCVPPGLRDPATRAVVERERMGSTAIVEIGVAVPHARVEGVGGVVAAMAASPTAVYAMAGVPISIGRRARRRSSWAIISTRSPASRCCCRAPTPGASRARRRLRQRVARAARRQRPPLKRSAAPQGPPRGSDRR
jgi:hypothetical protein